MKRQNKKQMLKSYRRAHRLTLLENGYYDGRFKPKTFRDKQKHNKKMLCRKRINLKNEL